MLFEKPLSGITASDILELISSKETESKYLEYKSTLPDDTDSAKVKFLSEVVSFANTSGGILVFGIEQDAAAAAQRVVGISTGSSDRDFLRLLHLIQNGIEPRVPAPDIREVTVDENKVFLLRVESSLSKPHRVRQNQKFYGRNASGRYELDVDELRNLFLLSNTAEKAVEAFRIGRLLKLKSEDFPFGFLEKEKAAVHVMPVASLNSRVGLDLRSIDQKLQRFFPMESGGHNTMYNFDGRMNYSLGPEGKMASYVQIFRNGFIESVISGFLDLYEKKHIAGKEMEKLLRGTVEQYIETLKDIGIDYPFFVSIAFTGIKGARITTPNPCL